MIGRRPTLIDVARESQLSPKTVSRVINGESNVSEEAARRVRAAINSLGFHPNENARSLRPGQRSKLIGLVIEDLGNPFYARLAAGVEEVARAHDNLVLMTSSEEDSQREREIVLALCRRRVDGLLMVPAGNDHRYLLPEINAGTPFVFVDRPAQELDSDVVVIDNRDGAFRGVSEFVRRGHTRIAIIGDTPGLYTAEERLAGYLDALRANAIHVDVELIRMGAHTPERAERITEELIAMDIPPTAIFASNNRICTGVLRSVSRATVRPEILGFDDLELVAFPGVKLWLLRYDPADLGRRAARLLFDRLDGAGGSPTRQVHITPELVDCSQSLR
jgi:LacI family transcriptional regulator